MDAVTYTATLVRRYAAAFAVVILAAAILWPHPAQPASLGERPPAAPLAFRWTPELARELPGCRAQLPAGAVASAFVVRRLDGSDERMAFDEAWRRTHDRAHADDVWVEGQCR